METDISPSPDDLLLLPEVAKITRRSGARRGSAWGAGWSFAAALSWNGSPGRSASSSVLAARVPPPDDQSIFSQARRRNGAIHTARNGRPDVEILEPCSNAP